MDFLPIDHPALIRPECEDQLIGDGMVYDPGKDAKIGAIRSIVLPYNWKIVSSSFAHMGDWSLTSFCPIENPKVELRIFCRAERVTADDAIRFIQMLERAYKDEQKMVGAAEIILLKNVLGPTVSDNQFTNLNPPASRFAARCQLIGTKVLLLNQRPVLIVEGTLTSSGIASTTRFLNVFFNVDQAGHEVQEIFFQSPLMEYSIHCQEARTLLNSIVWLDDNC